MEGSRPMVTARRGRQQYTEGSGEKKLPQNSLRQNILPQLIRTILVLSVIRWAIILNRLPEQSEAQRGHTRCQQHAYPPGEPQTGRYGPKQ